MNYIDDIRTFLITLYPAVPVFIENFASSGDITDQIMVCSEPSSVERQLPIVRLNFSVFVQSRDQQLAINISNNIFLILNNQRGKLDPVSSNSFSQISAVGPPYEFSSGGSTPLYQTKFNATIVDSLIKTYQYKPI
jgi:hypothetical protein